MSEPRSRVRRLLPVSNRSIGETLAAVRPGDDAAVVNVLRETVDAGRAVLRRRLEANASGAELVASLSRMMDVMVKALATHATSGPGRRRDNRLAVVAVGGYGRGELAPWSDLDLLFLLPGAPAAHDEEAIQRMLYPLWDLGLKVGHAVRTVDDTIERTREDMTIRTAVLEARFLWGNRSLFRTLERRFDREVVAGSGPAFVRAKLEERDARHLRLGDSRYVLEPNVKDGKGGLRDLHTLFWIAKYLYRLTNPGDLVGAGVLTRAEYARFRRAADLLARVRCHLHVISGRAEERLRFDLQREIANRMGYSGRRSQRAVERFMKRYFLVAKDVGGLTRIFASAIEESGAGRLDRRRRSLPPEEIAGFPVSGGMLVVRDRQHFAETPRDLVRMFHVAQAHRMDIHPRALWLITQNLQRVDGDLRGDTDANRLFMDILTSKKDPSGALGIMNEAGVMGRFLPDFGRVVAQVQHDMYHVYTVDEHSIRAIGILSAIEHGGLADELPLATRVFPSILQRRVLYLAVLLHDIAKGRGGDHSVLGAEVAENLAPRLGFDAEETETVSWLVSPPPRDVQHGLPAGSRGAAHG